MVSELPQVTEGERHGSGTALREAITGAWLACAPPGLADAHLNR